MHGFALVSTSLGVRVWFGLTSLFARVWFDVLFNVRQGLVQCQLHWVPGFGLVSNSLCARILFVVKVTVCKGLV